MLQFTTLAAVASIALSWLHPSPPSEGWTDGIVAAVLWGAASAALLTAALLLLLSD